MRQNFSILQSYILAFQEAARSGGLRFALRRTADFIQGRAWPNVKKKLFGLETSSEMISPFHDIISTLEMTPLDRSLILIISDIQIPQCVHYRIEQKIRYLEAIGLQAIHLNSKDRGRIKSFLGMAHSVIIYRTALPTNEIQKFHDAGAQVLFEFDDLIVGENTLESSGILSQLTDAQALDLRILSRELLRTAQACNGIILSSSYLSQLYKNSENGLADKPSYIIPNFVETDTYKPLGRKDITFAYTSPSGSIGKELSMLIEFLKGYDRVANRDWNILIMGNEAALKTLAEISFTWGKVISQSFSNYDDYLVNVSRTETVLIPLADNNFNRSKTAIRLMDAAISGTQALFCPVGEYQNIQSILKNKSLCIPPKAWKDAGNVIIPVLERQKDNLADLQKSIRQIYGVKSAKSCYKIVFIEKLGIKPLGQISSLGIS